MFYITFLVLTFELLRGDQSYFSLVWTDISCGRIPKHVDPKAKSKTLAEYNSLCSKFSII